MSQGLPKRCVTAMAFVLSVIRASSVSAVTFSVTGSTSAKTGMTPWARMAATEPMSVIGVPISSSPGSRSSAATMQCIAAEPEVQAKACFTPIIAANSSCSSRTWSPLVAVRQPESSASLRKASSVPSKLRPEAAWSLGSGSGVAGGGDAATGAEAGLAIMAELPERFGRARPQTRECDGPAGAYRSDQEGDSAPEERNLARQVAHRPRRCRCRIGQRPGGRNEADGVSPLQVPRTTGPLAEPSHRRLSPRRSSRHPRSRGERATRGTRRLDADKPALGGAGSSSWNR